MDVLSDILRVFELRGTLYFRAELGAPYGVEVPENENAARFHLALRGDLALVPHGASHRLTDTPTRPTTDLQSALQQSGYAGTGPFRYGGPGELTTLVCGHFAFAREILHPLLDALPPVLHFPAHGAGREGRGFLWLDDAIDLLGDEARHGELGAQAVLTRLSEILFIQMIRAYASTPQERSSVISALVDPQLGRALQGMHAEPWRAWSLDELARHSGMSRTVFAERFSQTVGLTPIQYLTRWRMERAKHSLRHTRQSLAQIGSSVGYRGESAFHRAFKRTVGVGPGAYRLLGTSAK